MLCFACSLAALAASPAALADGFRDKTPLPDSVGGSETTPATDPGGSGGGALVRMIVGLAIVLAVVYGVYWLMKSRARAQAAPEGDGKLQVVATTTLAPDRAIHLVRIGEELVLVGTAPNGVTPVRVYRAEQARRLAPYLSDDAELRQLAADTGADGAFTKLADELRRRTAR